MGHALEHSIIDVITRIKGFKDMKLMGARYRPCRNHYSVIS